MQPDLIPASAYKPDLFSGRSLEKDSCVMHAVDAINKRYGKDRVIFGLSLSQKEPWEPRFKKTCSKTNCDHLPIVKAE